MKRREKCLSELSSSGHSEVELLIYNDYKVLLSVDFRSIFVNNIKVNMVRQTQVEGI